MGEDSERDKQPEYTIYRTRPRLFRKRDDGQVDGLQNLREDVPRPGEPPPDAVPEPPRRRRVTIGRIAAYVALALVAWVLFSLLLFMVSAQIQRSDVSDEAGAALDKAGFTLTSPNTILVLGSDARTRSTAEPGSTVGGRGRSDSIMLMRIGGGKNASLSIPRDTVVDIPGHGRDKINAAYALGGPELAIETVRDYLGVRINHLVEVNFENFPELIDALGGVEYKGGCVVSRINGGSKNGGYTLRLPAGSQELDGKQALALARTRKNECNAKENDLTRAKRQQKLMSGIKDKVTSLETFIRLPWVSWAAPKAVRSDMAGPSLLGIVGASLSAGGSKPRLLKPSGGVTLPDGGAGLVVSEAEKRSEVARFLRG